MLKTTISAAFIAAVAAFAIPGSGQAAFIITNDLLTVPIATFNPAPASVTPVVQFVTGSVGGVYRSPFQNVDESHINPQHDTLEYTSVQADGSGIWNVSLADTLKLFWGSPDTYNVIRFYSGLGGTGTLLETVTGSNLVGPAVFGYGHDLVSILITSGFFQSVKISSPGSNAFEFTNFQTSCENCAPEPTPIPGAALLMGSVLAGGVGGMQIMRRRRKAA